MSKYIVTAIIMLIVAFAVFLAIRNHMTFNIHSRASDYIFRYKMSVIHSFERFDNLNVKALDELLAKVDYCDIEPYEVTIFKFWHNSWEDVLPSEKVALLKSYFKEG